MTRFMLLVLAAGVVSGLAGNGDTRAQGYPVKPIRMVIPQPPGGGNDLMGRLLGAKLSTVIGQPVVIDNRTGAAGAIGNRNVMQSAPDGYSILFGIGSDMVIAKLLSKDAPVDPVTDLTAMIAVKSVTGSTGASLESSFAMTISEPMPKRIE